MQRNCFSAKTPTPCVATQFDARFNDSEVFDCESPLWQVDRGWKSDFVASQLNFWKIGELLEPIGLVTGRTKLRNLNDLRSLLRQAWKIN